MDRLPILEDWMEVCSRLGLFSTTTHCLEKRFALTSHNPVVIFKLVARLDDDKTLG